MLNANNKVNYEPKQKEKKYSLSTVLAWLYLKTIGRILPGRWNQWAKNILHHNKVIVNNGVQTDAPEVVDQSVQISEVVAQEVQSKIISEGKTIFKDTEIQNEFVETEDKNEKLKEQLEGVSQALEVFIELCNNQAEYIENLQLESDFLKEEKEQLNSLIKKLKESYKELAKVARKRGEEFLVQLKKKSEEILRLQKELTECSKEFANKIEMLSVRVEEKDGKIGSLTELKKILEQEKKEMENKNNAQQQVISDLEKRIKEQDTLITSLTDENKDINETVKNDNESLRAQNTELESKFSKLNNESDTKIKQLENQLKEKQAELKQAKKKNTELEDLKKCLEKDKSDSSNKLSAAEKKKKELEDEVNELKEQVEKKDDELEGLKQQLEKEKTNLNAIEKEKKELESEVDKLQKKSQKLEESNVEIKKQKADLEKKLEFSQGENKKLQKQVEHLSAEQEKAKSVAVLSIMDSTKTLNENLTLKNQQIESSIAEGRQQKLQNKQKDSSKKPEDINKKTKADTKSIFSTSGSIKSKFSNGFSKLRGNKNLDKFLSDQNEKLKKSFPEFKGEHFCHNVLEETIKSLSNQGDGKFESDKLLALLEENLIKSGRAIIETQVNKVVTEVGKKHSIEQVFFVEECAKGLYLNEEDSKAVIHSFTDFLAQKNNTNNDSVKKFVVQKLTEAEMKCFSDKIQQLASSIRDKFLCPDQKMCVQTSEENNEYQLTDKAKKEYKLTPNSSMSHTTTSNIQRVREC
ncbi:hypothetical protein [Wolbachia endosymbiont of Protocalliphora sialia]